MPQMPQASVSSCLLRITFPRSVSIHSVIMQKCGSLMGGTSNKRTLGGPGRKNTAVFRHQNADPGQGMAHLQKWRFPWNRATPFFPPKSSIFLFFMAFSFRNKPSISGVPPCMVQPSSAGDSQRQHICHWSRKMGDGFQPRIWWPLGV